MKSTQRKEDAALYKFALYK